MLEASLGDICQGSPRFHNDNLLLFFLFCFRLTYHDLLRSLPISHVPQLLLFLLHEDHAS